MQPSPFKNEKALVLLFVVFLLGLGVLGAFASRVPPAANVVYGSGPSNKPVRVATLPYDASTNELACADAGGVWNDCGSACRSQPDAKTCIQVCVPYCECTSDEQCPADENNVDRLTCADYVDGVGVCR